MSDKQILCINTAGPGGQDSLRIRHLAGLLSGAQPTFYDVDKSSKRRAAAELWELISSRQWDLVYLENTGIAAGINLIRAARTRRQRYVVSAGDPISGFFKVTRGAAAAVPFTLYESALYRNSAGFIGWSPYLAGRALEIGAPRAVTVEGAVDTDVFHRFTDTERMAARARFGLPSDHLVCGVVGSLTWVDRQQYCYGLELIETLKRCRRPDISMLIVGDGDGRSRLEARVPAELRSRVIFAGRLPQADVVAAMNAMDVGFITQTLDELGAYRLTTKMPEYLACGLPVAMSPTPGYFDYIGSAAGWPLPAAHPASPEFHQSCAQWLDALCRSSIVEKSRHCREIAVRRFSYDIVGPRFREFIESILAPEAAQ
jgi:glycosyltransferase involved in cell wall biosynthesis